MARYPGATWDPSPNFRSGPTTKRRVVLHRMAGAYEGGLSWLKNPTSQVSANFTVDNTTGASRQLVDTDDIAWAQAAYNDDSISIEIGGQPGDLVVDAAWEAITSIVREAHQIDGVQLVAAIGPDFAGLAYHGQLGAQGGGHPDCPGPVAIAHIPAIIAAASGSSPGGDDMPKAYICEDPASDGTWAVLADDGEVDTTDGAPYLGGLNNHPEFHALDATHPIIGIAPWKDPAGQWGYKIGEYDPAPPAGQGRVRYYRFPRDGSLAH